ncbi:tetratricopeptide repeat protein [Vibrio brasiliensis]
MCLVVSSSQTTRWISARILVIYRSLGQYQQALGYFEQTMDEYPKSLEVQPFYAMCLYNLGRHKEATSLLLKLLVNTTNSEEIKQYQEAISLYAEDLDRTW